VLARVSSTPSCDPDHHNGVKLLTHNGDAQSLCVNCRLTSFAICTVAGLVPLSESVASGTPHGGVGVVADPVPIPAAGRIPALAPQAFGVAKATIHMGFMLRVSAPGRSPDPTSRGVTRLVRSRFVDALGQPVPVATPGANVMLIVDLP
jgi:hypothetical protein